MLDQLVESKSNTQENTRKFGFLLVIFLIMFLAVAISIFWSLSQLYNTYLREGMGGDLELTELVAPIPVQAEEPPPPPEEKPKEVTKVEQNVDVRKEIIQNIMESPTEPPKIEVTKPQVQQRRVDVKTVLGSSDSNADRPVAADSREVAVTQTQGIGDKTGTTLSTGDGDSDEPVIAKEKS
jgi:hypothetical protein